MNVGNFWIAPRVIIGGQREREREKECDGSMLDNLQDFPGVFLPHIVFLRLMPLLCPRYRSSYPARGSTNYIGGRGNATATDNRNRLQTFRMVSSLPVSTFHLLFSLYPPFQRALFHRRRQTIQPLDVDRDDTTKSSAELLSTWPSCLVSEVASRLLCDWRTGPPTTKTTTTSRRRRDFAGICLASVAAPPSFLRRSFISAFFSLFMISRSTSHSALHANARA